MDERRGGGGRESEKRIIGRKDEWREGKMIEGKRQRGCKIGRGDTKKRRGGLERVNVTEAKEREQAAQEGEIGRAREREREREGWGGPLCHVERGED